MSLIYFFTNETSFARTAFSAVSALHPEHDWRCFTIRTPAEREAFAASEHAPDLLISFLSPYVVPAQLLDQVKGRAYNIHPATPRFPGRDPYHFAYFEGEDQAGATLHRMSSRVDAGAILDVLTKPVDRALGIQHFIQESVALCLALLLRAVPALAGGQEPPALAGQEWRESARRTRKDFQSLCLVSVDTPAELLERVIGAAHVPGYQNVHLVLHGRKFAYQPDR